MPLNKFRVFISFLFIFTISTIVFAQVEPERTTLAELKANPPETPTSAEIMRDRISKAKAYLVVKNYGLAIYELENIRGETNDKTVHRVLNVLLMHAYLEQGDYIKAQKFLKELHTSKSSTAPMDYLAVAGQVVSGAKTQLERYRSLGLSVADRNLPTEASSDVENMRNTLELVIEQSKVLSKNKQVSANAFALLEETSSARGKLAKDAYDERLWKDQVADSREQLVNPNTKIINAVGNPPISSPPVTIVATEISKDNSSDSDNSAEVKNEPKPVLKPVIENKDLPLKEKPKVEDASKAPATNTVAKNDANDTTNTILPTDRGIRVIPSAKKEETQKSENKDQPNVKSTIQDEPKTETRKPEENNVAKNENKVTDDSPLPVGSLISFATKRVNPVYPRQARNMRMTGIVKVEVVVDEDGKVATVENTEGPSLLKRAASDAIKKWQFTPFERDGQPVKATGFVSFNFDL